MQPTNEKVTEAIAASKNVAHRIYVNWIEDHGVIIFYTLTVRAYPAIQCIGYAQAGQWFPADVQGQQ